MNTTSIEGLYDQIDRSGDAYPTGRLLPEPLDGEEWCEEGIQAGEKARIYYYFDADEIDEAAERCSDNPPEEYPWDVEHVAYITDDEGAPIIGRGWAGFCA